MNNKIERKGTTMLANQIKRGTLVMVGSLGLLLAGCQSSEPTTQVDRSATSVVAEPVAVKATAATPEKEKPAPVARREDAGLLSVNKMEIEFGKIEPRAKVNGEYILTNTGKEVLEIDTVGKSCGCTVPSLATKTLKPGQSVPLKITFNAPDRPGKVKKSVWITTKSPHMPKKITMTLTAEVIKFINIEPQRLSLVVADQPQTETVVLESTDGQPFKIVGITSTSSVASADFDKDLEATRHEVTLKIDSPKLRKALRGNIVIRLDHPKTKSATISYQAARPFVAKPATKYFRNLKPGITSEATLTVVSSSNVPFELGEIISDKGLAEVLTTEKIDDGYKIRFSLKVPEDKTSGRVQDFLKIAIKDHPEDTITVTCYGRIK